MRPLVPVIVPGVLASAIFSFVFQRFSGRFSWMDLAIGLIFLLVSGRMLRDVFRPVIARMSRNAGDGPIPDSTVKKVGIGLAGGALPGLLGIGTGGIWVPAFTYILKVPVKTAMGSSLACFCLNALVSAGFKAAGGFVIWRWLPFLALGSLLGADLGGRVNGRIRERRVKFFFGVVFLYVSMKFIASFGGVRI